MNSTLLIQTIGALLATVAFIIALAFVLRKMQNIMPKATGLKLAGGIMVGHKEKLVLVEIEKKWILLGVTSHNISKLYEFDEEPRAFQKVEMEQGFAKTLMTMIQK